MANNRNVPGPKSQSPEMSVDLIDRFLKNQSAELELRKKELEIQQQTERYAHDYSQAALTAQLKDREGQRDFVLRRSKHILALIGFVALVVVALVVVAMVYDKDQIAMEVVKAVFFLLSGGAGGYAIGKNAKNGNTSPPKDESN